MKILIVYTSFFGNTERLAKELHTDLKKKNECLVKKPEELEQSDLQNLNALVIASPTRIFQPTKDALTFIKSLDKANLAGATLAVFDTRIELSETDPRFLKFMIKLFGYASEKLKKCLAKKAGTYAIAENHFFVTAQEGPLKDGEISRAIEWMKKIVVA